MWSYRTALGRHYYSYRNAYVLLFFVIKGANKFAPSYYDSDFIWLYLKFVNKRNFTYK